MDQASTTIVPAAQSFTLLGGTVGILLIHGYGGSIGDYRAIGELLQHRGYSVSGVRLAGHGQGLEALRSTTIADWRGSVDQALADMSQRCVKLFILGSSFGGVLALDAALRHSSTVTGLLLVNTALSYSGGGIFQKLILRTLRHFTPYYQKRGMSEEERQRGREVGSTEAWPIRGILDTAAMAKNEIVPQLSQVTAPSLIIHSAHDPVVGAKNSQLLSDKLGSRVKRIISLPVATHRPFRQPDMIAFMSEQIDAFIQQTLA